MPDITLVAQVNHRSGEAFRIGPGPPTTGAAVLLFRSTAPLGGPGPSSEEGILIRQAQFDYGVGRTQQVQPIITGPQDFAVVVPWGYREAPKRVTCALSVNAYVGSGSGHPGAVMERPETFSKTWVLRPLPPSARVLRRPPPDKDLEAYHRGARGHQWIDVTARRPLPKACFLESAITKVSFKEPSLREADVETPFDADQDAARIRWRIVKRHESTGQLRLADCVLSEQGGKIHLDTKGAMARVSAGRWHWKVGVLRQTAIVYPRRRGTRGWNSVQLQCSIRSESMQPVSFPMKGATMTGSAGPGGQEDAGLQVSLDFAGPDLTSFGISEVTTNLSTVPNKAPVPRMFRTIRRGRLPPLVIRYRCSWSEPGPYHQSDVPIEAASKRSGRFSKRL